MKVLFWCTDSQSVTTKLRQLKGDFEYLSVLSREELENILGEREMSLVIINGDEGPHDIQKTIGELKEEYSHCSFFISSSDSSDSQKMKRFQGEEIPIDGFLKRPYEAKKILELADKHYAQLLADDPVDMTKGGTDIIDVEATFCGDLAKKAQGGSDSSPQEGDSTEGEDETKVLFGLSSSGQDSKPEKNSKAKNIEMTSILNVEGLKEEVALEDRDDEGTVEIYTSSEIKAQDSSETEYDEEDQAKKYLNEESIVLKEEVPELDMSMNTSLFSLNDDSEELEEVEEKEEKTTLLVPEDDGDLDEDALVDIGEPQGGGSEGQEDLIPEDSQEDGENKILLNQGGEDEVGGLPQEKEGGKEPPPFLSDTLEQPDMDLAQMKRDSEDISRHYNDDLLHLKATLESLKEDRGMLQKKLSEEEKRSNELRFKLNRLQAEFDEGKIEIVFLKKKYEKELDNLNYKAKLAMEKKDILLEKNKQLHQELEMARNLRSFDTKKIREREKELEGQLELLKIDSEGLIKSRDKLILELKRKIDLLEFDFETVSKGEKKAKEDKYLLENRLDRIMETLRRAIGSIDEDILTENIEDQDKKLMGF
ncbi:MAG: hypothetical protein OXB88_03800 [Bacteriovoracales bacterium]|nr:hypothetical protein [Bacteriovoracales bacterium]